MQGHSIICKDIQEYEAYKQGYEAYKQGHDANAQGYADYTQGCEAYKQGYEACNEGYEASKQGYEASKPGYEACNQRYQASEQEYKACNEGYEACKQVAVRDRGCSRRAVTRPAGHQLILPFPVSPELVSSEEATTDTTGCRWYQLVALPALTIDQGPYSRRIDAFSKRAFREPVQARQRWCGMRC